VAVFAFEQLLWAPRTLAMGALALSPVALALVYRALSAFDVTTTPGFEAFSTISSTIGFSLVAPVIALFYASGVVSDAVEAGSMTYFVTRPLSRSALLLGQMAGSFALLLLLFVPGLVISYYVCLSPAGLGELGSRFPSLLLHAAAAVLGLLAYNGLFSLAGTALRRPLLAGLFFVFGWQAVASVVPGSARYFTIAHYLHVLVPRSGLTGALASLADSGATRTVAVLALVLIGLCTHAAAIALFSRKEV
jgi:ABC-type transport system involved in multi-copper enzyme maturation permease subunit